MTLPEGPPAGPTASELHPRLRQRALASGAKGTSSVIAAEIVAVQDQIVALTDTVTNMPATMLISGDKGNIAVLGEDDGIYVPPDVMVISDDDGNIAVLGSDEGIYVPDSISASTAVGDSGWHYANAPGEPRTGPNYDYDVQGSSWGPIRWRRDAAGCVFMEGLLGANIVTSVDVPFITLLEGSPPGSRTGNPLAVVGSGSKPYKFVLEPNGDLYYAWEDPDTSATAFGSLAGDDVDGRGHPQPAGLAAADPDQRLEQLRRPQSTGPLLHRQCRDVHPSGLIKGGIRGDSRPAQGGLRHQLLHHVLPDLCRIRGHRPDRGKSTNA